MEQKKIKELIKCAKAYKDYQSIGNGAKLVCAIEVVEELFIDPSVAPTEERISIEEAKNKVAEEMGWRDFDGLIKYYVKGDNFEGLIHQYEKALSILNISTNREGWVKVEDGLPEIDTTVIVRTAYMSSGKEVNDYFMAYMDEYGDTIICPHDESYGWQFNDVVTHWMPLPQPPKETSK